MLRYLTFLLFIFPFTLFAKNNSAISLLQDSLLLIENKGQINDQFGNPRNDIQFKLQTGNGLTIFIGNGSLHYQWSKSSKSKVANSKSANALPPFDLNEQSDSIEMYRMDVTLIGANPNSQIITEEKQEYCERYYNSPAVCNEQGVIINLEGIVAHSYKKITYKNIYPGIDWVVYVSSPNEQGLAGNSLRRSIRSAQDDNSTQQPSLKYDFMVHPGGNPKNIQLEYGGATSLVLNEDKSITATTPFGTVTEQAPFSYIENGKEVASKFILQNNIIGFDVVISPSNTLIIDPQLKWATYFGGSVWDEAYGVTSDATANAFISGATSSISNIATIGAYQTIYAGGVYDVFVAKFNSAGSIQWATYYGGSGSDYSYAITSDIPGNVFITGQATSTSGIATAGAFLTSPPGGSGEAFLAKFSGSGTLQWATYYGDTMGAICYAVACDGSNNVYISGQTASTSNMATPGAFQPFFGGGQDVFIAKFSSTGARQWGTYFGGTGGDICQAIVCEGTTNVYLAGSTSSSSGIASAGSYQSTYGGGSGVGDAFLAKFTSTGGLQWATYYGGSNPESAKGVACDNTGNIYITGTTQSTSAIASTGSYQTTFGGGTDAFVAKFSNAGSLQWATYFGGSDYDAGYAVSAQHNGYVYIIGTTFSSSNITTPNAYQATYGGTTDAFLVKFDNTGKRITSTYFGGTAEDRGFGLYVDPIGVIYMSGHTSSTSNIATPSAYQTTYGGGSHNAILAKFLPDSFIVTRPFVDTSLCVGDSLLLHYKIDYMFHTGNVFTAQLSGPTGSFASPVNIGTFTDTLAGTIHCFIPTSTASGSGYRIRVISSNPTDTSYDDGVNIQIINFSTFSANSNSPLCVGDSLKFSVTNGIAGLNYNWSGPGSFNSVVQNPYKANVQLADSGIYTLIASLASCIDTETVQVIVKPVPNAVIAGSNSPVCAGDTLSLNCSTSTSGVTYNWIGPGYGSSQQSPNILNVQTNYSGNYIITVSLSGCTAKDTVSVTVNPVVVPSVTISTSPSPVHPGSAATYTANPTNCGSTPSYQWKKNGVNISGATNPTYAYTPAAHDTICVVMHSNAACAVPDTAKSCNIAPLQIASFFASKAVEVWPNPNNGWFTISSTIESKEIAIEIVNMLGQSVYKAIFEVQNNKLNKEIHLNNVPAGIYMLQLTSTNGERIVKKIIKQ